ncbi:MAG: energy transducer TonB [Bacteroidales bacterium]|nr:energy transducer TonB [Bacteroidales bacterium]
MNKIKLLFITFTFLFSINLLAQTERKKKTKYKDEFKEKYYVLKKNRKIKDGLYVLTFKKDTIAVGIYTNNNKDSIWDYYNSIGELELKYDYNGNKIVYWDKNIKTDVFEWYNSYHKDSPHFVVPYDFSHPIDSIKNNKKYKVYASDDTLQLVLDQPPLFFEGTFKLQLELFSVFQKIDIGLRDNTRSLISFKIDKKGNAFGFNIDLSSGKNFEKQFVELLKEKELKWIPGILNGEPVVCEFIIPISIVFEVNKHGWYRNTVILNDFSLYEFLYSGKDNTWEKSKMGPIDYTILF